MSTSTVRKLLIALVVVLVPVGWLAAKYQPYSMDGDAMAYMDIADLMRAHHWAGVVNGYWNPLYPAGLAAAQALSHTTRWNEIGAYYVLNYLIFLASIAAVLAFVTALVRLRTRMLPSADQDGGGAPLLGLDALRLLGVALVTVAAQRELSPARILPDALLQALMLAAFAMLLQALATESLLYAPLLGLFLGLAYLTKSFAFVVALLSIAVMVLFQALVQRRSLWRAMAGGLLTLVVFAAVAGPYIAALSKQKGRFDFGDSGALNYAWYVSGTDKMHIEPWMTAGFGSATVRLAHPEKQLLAHPEIYSYKAVPYGTYPDWFDTAYFHERVVPRFDAGRLFRRDLRNLVLVVRYLFNHPEAWMLLALLLVFGARLRCKEPRREGFWLPMVALGLAMWVLYGLVNVEERYVTLAYLAVVLPVFAMLRSREASSGWQRPAAAAMVALLAFAAAGETLRTALEDRRYESGSVPLPYYSAQIFGAAQGLAALGVRPGDEIACVGTTACLHDPYWQRLAGVRVLTEIYNPNDKDLIEQIEGLPNRQQVYDVLRGEGAKVLVGRFDPGEMTGRTPASTGWLRLGTTDFYALPLNLNAASIPPTPAVTVKPWTPKMEVAP